MFKLFYLLFLYKVLSENLHCPFEELPKTLNSISYLDFNNEFHVHQPYLINLTEYQHEITFSLKKDSVFRIYIAPHDVDVDLWLYSISQNGQKILITNSSLDIGTEEVIAKTLLVGNYSLSLPFFGYWMGNYIYQECDTIIVEMSIVPV